MAAGRAAGTVMVTISSVLITNSHQLTWTHVQIQVSDVTSLIVDMSNKHKINSTYLGLVEDHKAVNCANKSWNKKDNMEKVLIVVELLVITS